MVKPTLKQPEFSDDNSATKCPWPVDYVPRGKGQDATSGIRSRRQVGYLLRAHHVEADFCVRPRAFENTTRQTDGKFSIDGLGGP